MDNLIDVFREVCRVLSDTGLCFINYGDSYGKGQQLMMMPSRVAIALQDDGWILRSEIIWHKPNPMPVGSGNRPVVAHEKMFMLAKKLPYFWDADAVRAPLTEKAKVSKNRVPVGWASSDQYKGQDARDKVRDNPTYKKGDKQEYEPRGAAIRNVWTIPVYPFRKAHFATFPPALVEPCVRAGCKRGGVVLDPFGGAGTTALVALAEGRDAILCEANPEYAQIAYERLTESTGELLNNVTMENINGQT